MRMQRLLLYNNYRATGQFHIIRPCYPHHFFWPHFHRDDLQGLKVTRRFISLILHTFLNSTYFDISLSSD
ncbi:hypothetical protein BJX63DRAFT_405761 [Aspergillus granulosus]|uniref:Uncharacterized protein n=1 Tax=Aspergillus granulosus TaxID=176169 RepID=A0ABR4H1S1_9EURO